MFGINIKAPRLIDVKEIAHYIRVGRMNRIQAGRSDPYAQEANFDEACIRDAAIIAKQYDEASKKATDAERMKLYKEIMRIQFGLDPVPRVGDFYEGHTVTDVVRVDTTVELYGVLGKLPKRELKIIIEEANKLDCLRDKTKRRGYRFAVLETL